MTSTHRRRADQRAIALAILHGRRGLRPVLAGRHPVDAVLQRPDGARRRHSSPQTTPPPGIAGGLLNAIYGSVVMTLLATLIGTPIGIMAGDLSGRIRARQRARRRRSASSTTSC